MPVSLKRAVLYKKFKNICLILKIYESIIIIGLWGGTFTAGFIGYILAFASINEPYSWIDVLYVTIQLFFMKYSLTISPPNILLQVSRFLAPALMFSSIVYLISSNLRESYKRLTIRLSRDHVIICGLGLLGTVLVRDFCKNYTQVIVIEKDPKPTDIELCKNEGASILSGDATKSHILKSAGVGKAKYLIAVTGDDEVNADIAGTAADIPRYNPVKALTCYLHVVNLNIYTMLKIAEFQNYQPSSFRLDIFNVYETAGNAILDKPEPFLENINDPSNVRILVIGLGRLGENLICNAANRWKTKFGITKSKLLITILDKNVDEKLDLLLNQYPAIRSVCDFTRLSMDCVSSEFSTCSFLTESPKNPPYYRIFVCLGNPSLGLQAGLTISKKMSEINYESDIPIIIRTNYKTGLSHFIGKKNIVGDVFPNIIAFSLQDEISRENWIINAPREMIAQAIHEDYIEKEKTSGKIVDVNPIMVPWNNLPEAYKESNRLQADNMVYKLNKINCRVIRTNFSDNGQFEFTPDEIEELAGLEHERWMNEKIETGWKYGKKRYEIGFYKRHPLLIPFKDLSFIDQEKDRNSIRLIPALLNRVNLEIQRIK